MVCIRPLMVEIDAQISETRNSDTNRSPNVMDSKTSTMYVGMMKSVPSVTHCMADTPCSL